MPAQFQDFLSAADLKQIVQSFPYGKGKTDDKKEQEERSKSYQEILKEKFTPALQSFITCLRKEGRLGRVEGIEGRQIRFANAWNHFLDGGVHEDWEWEEKQFWNDISMRITRSILFSEIYRSEDNRKSLKKTYQDISEIYNRGDIESFMLGTSEDYDSATGSRLSMDLRNWTPGWLEYDSEKAAEVRVGPVDIAPVAEMLVEFKTSHLLISDWFRIQEFTDSVELEDMYSKKLDINNTMGREATCRAHWEQHDFITVNLGNTSPRVYEIDGTLTFGRVNDEWENQQWDSRNEELQNSGDPVPEGAKELGSVCTDLWAATIIERSRLVEIIAEKTGKEKAEREVAKYIERNSNFITEYQVEPGQYYLYWSGDYNEFQDKFAASNLELPDAIEPIFVLSSRKLDIIPKIWHEAVSVAKS